MGKRGSKRYVLLVAGEDLTAEEVKELGSVVERRHPGAKVIQVEGNSRAIIIRTTNEVAPVLRTGEGALKVGGKELTPVLTSGAVGNLKRRASRAGDDGQVHE